MVADALGDGTGLEAVMADSRAARVEAGVVVVSMESRTAEARGVSGGCGWLEDGVEVDVDVEVGFVVGRLSGEMAFSVRERIAFWDFLVPNARPRAMRDEGC